jgi:hypothetical protein
MPGIFISYRRSDTGQAVGRLSDRLREQFGRDRIFVDVYSIAPGLDFVEVINREVTSCDVLIAMIGKDWLTASDGQGRRRLDDEHDFVRIEIEAALQHGVRVVPLLVDRAKMPRADDVPPSLRALMSRQPLNMDYDDFNAQASRLIQIIQPLLPWVADNYPRRVTGILGSYTWWPAGKLLPIREGKTVIKGVPEDDAMSSTHATILCRQGNYDIVDHSLNGTFLNGKRLTINISTDLPNYADIRTGGTMWTFIRVEPPLTLT